MDPDTLCTAVSKKGVYGDAHPLLMQTHEKGVDGQ